MTTTSTHPQPSKTTPTSTGIQTLPRELQQKLALLRLAMEESTKELQELQGYYESHGMDDYGYYGQDVLARCGFLGELQKELASAFSEGIAYETAPDEEVKPADAEAILARVDEQLPPRAHTPREPSPQAEESFETVEEMVTAGRERRAKAQQKEFRKQYQLERDWFFRQGALPLAPATSPTSIEIATPEEFERDAVRDKEKAKRASRGDFTWPPRDYIRVPFQLCSERTALPIHEDPSNYETRIRGNASFNKEDAWLLELATPVVEATRPVSVQSIITPDIASFGPKNPKHLKSNSPRSSAECFKALRDVKPREAKPPP